MHAKNLLVEIWLVYSISVQDRALMSGSGGHHTTLVFVAINWKREFVYELLLNL